MRTHDLEITKNGATYRLSNNSFTDRDVEVIGFDVDTVEYEYEYEQNDRLNGRFLLGKKQTSRKAKLTLRYDVKKMAHVVHLKNNLAKLLSGYCRYREMRAMSTEILFQTMLDPNQEFKLDYVSGKEIELTLAAPISFDTNRTRGTIEIDLETGENPFYQSIGRSLELEKGTQMKLWSSDMEIDWKKKSPKRQYTFTNLKQGNVYYHGDIPINQFTQDCTVSITLNEKTKHFSWFTQYGEEMVIDGIEMKAGDVLKWDGIQVYKNNIPINEYARGVAQPVFQHGYNQFRFYQPVRKVVFDMKFYYE